MRAVSFLAAAAFLASPLSAQSSCRLEGAWQLVSGSADGKPYPTGTRGLKIITKGHFAVFSEEPGVPTEIKSPGDSLAMFRHAGSSGGTYTLQGTTYTEKVDYYPDPAYVGKAIPFVCRTEGDRFYQSGNVPILDHGKTVGATKLEEVWKRIE